MRPILIASLYVLSIPVVLAVGLKDVYGKMKCDEDFLKVKQERDKCCLKLKEVIDMNNQLEMQRDDLIMANVRLQTENTRRIFRMENSIRELEEHQH